MLEDLKQKVCKANLELKKQNIVIYTWGNVSEIDREKKLVVIKPSGIDYSIMKPDDMVIVDLITGKVVEGKWKPSSDTATHLEIYKAFPEIGGIVHTHSKNAVSLAQAGIDIKAMGTTHADYFYGDIKCTRSLTQNEVSKDYEKNTGKVIIETIGDNDPMKIPAILVKGHGPFTWGTDCKKAVESSVVLEYIAEMAIKTEILNKKAKLENYILDKHYLRKHGEKAYYGQK